MVVIDLHPTEKLKLIKYQKELISILNESGFIFYSQQPLWIELPETIFSASQKIELKTIGNELKKITLKNTDLKNDEIFAAFEILLSDNKTVTAELPLLHLYKKNGSENTESISVSSLPLCPVKDLKIFRIALGAKTSEHSQEITDFIWKKL